jgi:hypothetical protein
MLPRTRKYTSHASIYVFPQHFSLSDFLSYYGNLLIQVRAAQRGDHTIAAAAPH